MVRHMQNDNRNIPEWISQFVPKELVESTLFRFNIELSTISYLKCEECGHKHTTMVDKCGNIDDGVACNSRLFKRVYKKVKLDLVPDVDLNYDVLEEQMEQLPSQYTFYAMLYSEAKLKVNVEERRLKAIKGTIIQEIQQSATQSKVKIPIELAKSIVESDSRISDADKRLQIAQMQCGKLYHMLEALKIKSELARSLAGFKKQEMH